MNELRVARIKEAVTKIKAIREEVGNQMYPTLITPTPMEETAIALYVLAVLLEDGIRLSLSTMIYNQEN